MINPFLNVIDPAWKQIKLDESTARRHLKSPRSLSGRSLHLTLVIKWSRSHISWKIQISRSWPMPKHIGHISGLEFKSKCLIFVSGQSDNFWLRYSQFHIWPWKFKVKVMAKVEPNGHTWSLEFSRCVCFSFLGNRTTFGWNIANYIFDLEKSRSWPRSNPMVTFEVLWSIDFVLCQSHHFCLRYSKFHSWPWKFKVMVMVKIKPDGHIWGLVFSRRVCSSLRGNQTIFGWDIANSIEK